MYGCKLELLQSSVNVIFVFYRLLYTIFLGNMPLPIDCVFDSCRLRMIAIVFISLHVFMACYMYLSTYTSCTY